MLTRSRASTAAGEHLERLAQLGIDFDTITLAELPREGVAAFAKAYDDILTTLGSKAEGLRADAR
ncbi:hypothetical protein BH20ACT18_BH20ACT18_10890 [soil metagenome]